MTTGQHAPHDRRSPMFTIPVPDEQIRQAARRRIDALATPRGALGRLAELAAWLCAAHGVVPPRPLDDVRVVVCAGDHGVSATNQVSAYPRDVTAAMVRMLVSGTAGVNVLAAQAGARVRVLDIAVDSDLPDVPAEVQAVKIRRGSGDIAVTDALAPGEAERAFDIGRMIADEEIDSGAEVLIPGDLGIGNSTIAAALVAALLGIAPDDVAGTGTGVDEAGRLRKAAVIDAALTRATGRMDDPFDLLTAVGSACAATMAGLLVQAAVRAVPVLLDGVFTTAAALVAHRIAPDGVHWWLAGHRSTEPSQKYALTALGLDPILDLSLRLGEGSGAVQAVPVLRAARAVLAEMGLLTDLG